MRQYILWNFLIISKLLLQPLLFWIQVAKKALLLGVFELFNVKFFNECLTPQAVNFCEIYISDVQCFQLLALFFFIYM